MRVFDGPVLAEAEASVPVNAHEALNLATGQHWPLHPVRGQITHLPPGSLREIERVIARADISVVSDRASLRATLPDRLPLLAALEDRLGLYVAAGHASCGVVWAGLLGEALADLMTGQPLPLELELIRAIAPERFARK